jgi:hypothetical protein
MKTANEIRQKIDEYMEKINGMGEGQGMMTDIEKENYCCIVDALLWVIDDNSGKPI